MRSISIIILSANFAFVMLLPQNNVCSSIRDYFSLANNTNCWYNFAADAKVPDIIKRTGYPFMEYKIQTKDGYILTIFRIPNFNSGKPAVFLLHGVHCTAGIFVGLGRNSLAFLLADRGYDVWLGNYRGTEYSEGHAYLNVTQKEYWDFGADQIGLIDVPNMLQLVRYHAGHKGKIIYIGHSLGTTAALMYASEYPDHAEETVQLFVLLSPAYKLNNMLSPYRLLLPFFKSVLRIANDLNFVQLLSGSSLRNASKPICLTSPPVMLACLQAFNLFLGPFSQMAPETIPVFFNMIPGGTSFKTLVYISEAVRGRFKKYDYGSRNSFHYGSETPPEYDITKINVPTYIMYAAHDWATSKRDALNLYKKLPKRVRYGIHEIPNLFFNHLDMVFGSNSKKLVAEPLMKVMDKFLNSTEDINSMDKLEKEKRFLY